ncbi:MAG: DUF362 domain-containing protein [Blautia sp.]|jgi:uncharacterized protein (DUF362 family)/Pyruvate/2-oxoacid:ferredoxin oxidoreductase delta subunit
MKKSKVILLSCEAYEEELVYRKLKAGLSLLGGLETMAGKDENILLKPNLLKRAESEKAVITHPVVMGAFARILQEEGYLHVRMGDSCGVGQTEKVIAGTGMDTCMERYGVQVADFTEGVKTAYPEGHQAKEFVLAKEVCQADAIFNICKMKTHALERITGAVKNMYGCVQGLNKAKGHTKYPSADSFARMLVDLNQLIKPRLYLMDGIVAMEGNGPGSGDPVPMKVLLMGTDPVAVDSVFCHLIYLRPELVPTNYHGEKLGLGHWRPEKIELLTEEGEISMEAAVSRYGKKDFQVDRSRTIQKWGRFAKVFNIFQKKPYIVEESCIRCGICVESCPVEEGAVCFSNGRELPPVYDYRKCIRCFCCQEMCPKKAIQVK